MAEEPVNTTQLHNWLERMRAGDKEAREELLRSVCHRLERLAHKMLRSYPAVQRWADTDDVLQNSLLRLLRALEQVQPGSMREFFGLAAAQIRRELLDLARHYYGPLGEGARHDSIAGGDEAASRSPLNPPEQASSPDDLERWCAFHEEVDRLPPDEREVVSLIFYHGWTQAQVAELFGVTERTVRRWWQSALMKLHQHLKEGMAENGE